MSKKSLVSGISGKLEPVVSQPLKTLVNDGKSRKVVVECTEMHIGNKGVCSTHTPSFFHLFGMVLHSIPLDNLGHLCAITSPAIILGHKGSLCPYWC